jgi:hypothetical protein
MANKQSVEKNAIPKAGATNAAVANPTEKRRLRSGEYQTGQKGGPGRPKGSQNKLTLQVKECILQAFDELGGVDYLVEVGRSEPRTFLILLGKILPTEVIGDLNTTGIINVVTGIDRAPNEAPEVSEGEAE